MKIVIDIPKKVFDRFCRCTRFPDEVEEAIIAIVDGTILPKGHGRLIDANEIKWYGCTTESDCPYKDRACKDCFRAECSKTQVDEIQPIIEADKAERANE